MEDIMQKIVSLCKRRGFVFPGSEIYGGLANSWDYGPLGAQLRKNIKDSWWHTAVESRRDVVGIDGALMMNTKVWEASGHVATFNDPLVEDTVTNKRYRADHLLEDWLKKNGKEGTIVVDGMPVEKMAAFIAENNIVSPDGNPLTEPKQFNLMFQTSIGTTNDEKNKVYLRPETAQAMFVDFKNVLGTSRKRLPFGIAQIGKAFRNEITPGNFIFRTLEFEAMEIEYFIEESGWEEHFEYWAEWMEKWAKDIGIDTNKLHRYEVEGDALAHYSKRTLDFFFDFPFGSKELWGLAYRTDFDLTNHASHSGEKLEYADPDDNSKKIVPHVVEPAMGVDRTLLALMISAYHEEQADGETRIVLKFTPEMAPVQVAVLPLMKKNGMSETAEGVFDSISNEFRCDFDESGSIGKRYRRQDEIGTPLCITIDHDTLQDGSVTVRDRDTMEQTRVKKEDLLDLLKKKLCS
ncbi:MAG: glycine--tRNA ligase [Candidatus Magasanikbacteria bacterium CG11_big_fil_rev_8_21_14_0_20_39_34]|uniref:Glycine--tRNA ligase n=1 Tax=Candidatus Magasanikbacteria bacterium CG11_big_fil_rev_8_21_14_0_20_39_34 TaxID=1974653 RepID=A0A2H0N436_9BACT|nr:MAG: glycine--tRNA ligase [Candidatus Magasanikbacteria bacterium CG11_big_fil_rev_8_21_14_0_20_39_34]